MSNKFEDKVYENFSQLNYEFLYKEFVENKKCASQIAKEVGCKEPLVRTRLQRYQINRFGVVPYEVGQKFGYFTLVSYVTKENSRKNRLWTCRCVCGKLFELNEGRLPVRKSCGCKLKNHGKYGKDNRKWKGAGAISGAYWAVVKRQAAERGLSLTVTVQQAWELFEKQAGCCALTGWKIEFQSTEFKNPRTASLDRIDSSKDYTIDNVQWVHKDINRMKMDFGEKRLVEMAVALVYFQAMKAVVSMYEESDSENPSH